MAREKRQIQSNSKETGSSAAGSAADAAMGAAASAATAGYQSRPAATPDEGVSPMDGLPFELENMVAEYVGSDPQSAANLAATCRRYHDSDTNNLRLARKLLECVADGNQDKAERLLKMRPDLLTLRLPGYHDKHTDTRFKSVSVWEYALWAWDTFYMGNMMLDCIPETPEGAEIKSIVEQQYEQHNLQGLECIAEDDTHYFQTHFDIQPLLTAYTSYIEAYTALRNGTPLPNAPNWDAVDRLWLAVGRVQRRLVMHLRQHYCDDKRDFNSLNGGHDGLARSSIFINLLTGVNEAWDSRAGSRLGFDFGIYAPGAGLRVVGAGGIGDRISRIRPDLAYNSAAVAALFEVRKNGDYAALATRLASGLNPTPGAAGPAGLR